MLANLSSLTRTHTTYVAVPSLGTCTRGLTCFYQHDPTKVAVCWPFLQDKCPNTVDFCPLSHDPTPERTPLCVHFANNGRCNRPNCPFPHVRVGQREGICRDFAVLGYCAKGLDCDKQHVRECPDFAERGSCTTLGCKLPHVIRANRNRKAVPPASSSASSSAPSPVTGSSSGMASSVESEAAARSGGASSSRQITAEDAQLGDEFISLTFRESESEEDNSGEDDEEEEDEDDDDGEEGQEPPSEADVNYQ